MTSLLQVPPTLRALTDEEIERVDRDHPRPEDKTIDTWCPTCWGTKRFTFYAADELKLPHRERRLSDYECICLGQFKLWRLFHYTGLGEHYGRLGWADVLGVDGGVFEFIHDYLANLEMHLRQGTGLYLTGPNGNGKTLLASLVFRHFLALGYSGCWTTYNEMLDLYSATWRNQDEKAWFDNTVKRAQVLVIDDLGKESVNLQAMSNAALDMVFRHRVQSGHVTILTTNMADDELRERYSRSMISLITEACLSRAVPGEDWRQAYFEIKQYETMRYIVRPFTLR
jgi:hypothetical protein